MASMYYKPTLTGGRILAGDTIHGKFLIEWDSANELVRCEHQPKEPELVGYDPVKHRQGGCCDPPEAAE